MKKILSIGSKQFLTGIAPNAHTETGGIFFKADGITPLFEAGVDQSVNNGLLMGGAAGTTIGGSLTGTIIGAAKSPYGSAAYFNTNGGHIFSLAIGSSFSSVVDAHTISNLTSGLETFGTYLYYFQQAAIGRYDFASTWTDTWTIIATDYIHATHKYFDTILFGNGFGKIGSIDSSETVTQSALDFDSHQTCTDISDDGTYAVIAITDNYTANINAMADTRVLFWDGFTSSWLREYPIPDPFVYSLRKTSIGLFASGVTGIWQVTFNGVKKVYSRSSGIYSQSSTPIVSGRLAASHYSDAVIWGGSSGSNKVIKSFGKLDITTPNTTIHPFLSTASKNITYVDGQIQKGYIFVGDDTPLLKAYPLSTTNSPQTSLVAQTVYFQTPEKYTIDRVDVVFGEPLVSGDSMSIQLKTDEDATAITALTATYATDGAIRKKKLRVTGFVAEDQFSIIINFTAGAVKIKKIEVWGTPNNL